VAKSIFDRVVPHLQRITSGNRFIPQIDGLRFVAILSVVLFHIHGSLAFGGGAVKSPFGQPLVQMLSTRGVQLFFVISGFILGMPFASARLGLGKPVLLRAYFLRRLTRLEPPYILNMLICTAIGVIAFHAPLLLVLPHLGASLLYSHQIFYGSPSVVNLAAWSLEVEIQFYVLAPLLTYMFVLKSQVIRRVLLAMLTLLFGFLSNPLFGHPAECSFLYYGGFFLAGFLLCDLYLVRGSDWLQRSWKWDIAALLAWPLVWYPEQQVVHVLLPFLIVFLYVAAFRGKFCAWLFSRPLLTVIGGMCYTMYLFHYFAISIIGHFSKPIHIGNSFAAYFILQCLFILPGVLLITTFFYLTVERPCMDRNWPRKLAAWCRIHWDRLFSRRSSEPVPVSAAD
jgi:peptidoglycan/LPS O-acetylase OafA/YrhL